MKITSMTIELGPVKFIATHGEHNTTICFEDGRCFTILPEEAEWEDECYEAAREMMQEAYGRRGTNSDTYELAGLLSKLCYKRARIAEKAS